MFKTLKQSKNFYFISRKVEREDSDLENIYLELGNSKPKQEKPKPGKISKISCTCKNSKCLKLYCECFSSQSYCDPATCSCKDCNNTVDNEVKYFFELLNLLNKHFWINSDKRKANEWVYSKEERNICSKWKGSVCLSLEL